MYIKICLAFLGSLNHNRKRALNLSRKTLYMGNLIASFQRMWLYLIVKLFATVILMRGERFGKLLIKNGHTFASIVVKTLSYQSPHDYSHRRTHIDIDIDINIDILYLLMQVFDYVYV